MLTVGTATTPCIKSPRVTSSRTSVCSWSTSTKPRPRSPAQRSSQTRWRPAVSRTRFVVPLPSYRFFASDKCLHRLLGNVAPLASPRSDRVSLLSSRRLPRSKCRGDVGITGKIYLVSPSLFLFALYVISLPCISVFACSLLQPTHHQHKPYVSIARE